MNWNVAFLLLGLVWIISLLCAMFCTVLNHLTPHREAERKQGLFWVKAGFFIGFPLLAGLNAFWDPLWPGRLTVPSPQGEYALEQRYTDFLTIGYRGNTYLVVDGTRYFVDDYGPGNAFWVGEDRFIVGNTCYSVGEFTR